MVIGVYLVLARDTVVSGSGKTTPGSVDFSWALATRIGAITVVPMGELDREPVSGIRVLGEIHARRAQAFHAVSGAYSEGRRGRCDAFGGSAPA